jgi:hypothetical protein
MSAFSVPNWLNQHASARWPHWLAQPPAERSSLSDLAQLPVSRLPRFVRESQVAMHYLQLLGPLDWPHFPDRPDQRFNPHEPPLSLATFAGAYLVKIDQHLAHMADLHEYLLQRPPLVWVPGLPLVPSSAFSWGFDVQASLPNHRHLSRLLRTLPPTSHSSCSTIPYNSSRLPCMTGLPTLATAWRSIPNTSSPG